MIPIKISVDGYGKQVSSGWNAVQRGLGVHDAKFVGVLRLKNAGLSRLEHSLGLFDVFPVYDTLLQPL